MPRRHIKDATLQIGGATVRIRTAELTTTVEAVEVTDTGSGGHKEFLEGGGTESGEFTFEAFWFDDALPNADPPNIRAGALETFTLTLGSGGKVFSGSMYIEEVNYAFGDADGTDAITYEVTAQVSSPLTYPTP